MGGIRTVPPRHSRGGGNPYWLALRSKRERSSLWIPACAGMTMGSGMTNRYGPRWPRQACFPAKAGTQSGLPPSRENKLCKKTRVASVNFARGVRLINRSRHPYPVQDAPPPKPKEHP
ncbi:MAG: hypothetical protein EOP67_48555 [Sphingomonas sp.]|nr:MAG: hypothetical protein EOP67_48555 [Sphingomonas sp.]